MPTVTQINVRDRMDLGFVRGMAVPERKPVKSKPVTPAETSAAPKIRKISATAPVVKTKLKVAAYCRVSTLQESQEGSIYA